MNIVWRLCCMDPHLTASVHTLYYASALVRENHPKKHTYSSSRSKVCIINNEDALLPGYRQESHLPNIHPTERAKRWTRHTFALVNLKTAHTYFKAKAIKPFSSRPVCVCVCSLTSIFYPFIQHHSMTL